MRIFEKKFFHHPFFGWIFGKICIYLGAKTMRIFEKICFLSQKFMKFVLVQDTSFFLKIRMSSLIQIHTPLRVVRGFGAIQTIFIEKRYWVAYALA